MPDRAQAAPPPGAILLVTPRWTRDGGIAAHVQRTAAALTDAGVEVHVLVAEAAGEGAGEAPGRPAGEAAGEAPARAAGEAAGGVTLHVEPALTDRAVAPSRRLAALPDARWDAIHLHEFEDPAMVAALRQRGPVLISVHGYSACTSDLYYFRPGDECSRGHGPGCWPNLLLRGCAHRANPAGLPSAYARTSRSVAALRLADMALSYSSAVDRHLANNAIAHRRKLPLFATLDPPEGIAPAPRRVLFAGRVVPAKGLDVLVRAIAMIDAELVVCGEGWQLATVEQLARRKLDPERFAVRGWLTPEQLGLELAAATVVALPSRWPEPFGLVGIEAHLARRPVVASATGGVTDWLDDGVSGVLVKPGDSRALAAALEQLLADPARCAAMGEAARRSVLSRFTVERHLEAAFSAYADARASWLAAGRGAGTPG